MVVIRFQLQVDCLHVLVDGHWKLFDQYVVAQRWKPKFDPSKAKIEQMVVWVRIPHISMEYYREDAIKTILMKVGTPLKLDMPTAGVAQGRFARAAVEIDITKPVVAIVMVDDFPQKIEFEGLHVICFDCGEVEHRSDMCPKSQSAGEGVPETQYEGGLHDSMHVEKVQTPVSIPKHGAWMIVNHKSK